MIRIHYLQHVPFEGLGHIESWALSRGHRLSVSRLYNHDVLPDPETFDGLIIMGGPMNVQEDSRYHWLISEKRIIAMAMEQGKFVLGICLGAQLIATVCGARIYANPHKEIGWHPVSRIEHAGASPFFSRLPEDFPAFHWHGDTFDLPNGATWLARSEGCRHQAFSLGDHVLALQFHLESTKDSIRQLMENCADEIIPGPYIQTPQEILARLDHLPAVNGIMEGILGYFEGLLE